MTQVANDDDAAAYWATLLDAGALDEEKQAALNAWLSQSPRRAASLLRAQAALSYLDRGRALAGGDPTPDADEDRSWHVGRRGFLAAGAALAATLAGVVLWSGRPQVVDTGIGELRRVPLADGSSATLNTRTRMQIAMRENTRTIRLDEGEAWFRVARNKQRPFVVEVGDIRVRAVGTAFSVRRRDGGADVLVTEGIVETWVVGREDKRKQIVSGSRGYIPEIRAEIEVAAAPQEIERVLAWRGGELALNGETLGYAVSELNRYNVRQIVILNPGLQGEPLVGYFRTTEPENFARTVAAMLGARVVTQGNTIRIEKI